MEKQSRLSEQQIKNYVRAVIYIRTAADTAAATAEQRKECMEYLEGKGYFFMKEYADIATRGTNNIRSAFDAMTIDAHIGEFDRIIVFSLSRISRSQNEALAFCADLQDSCGVIVESVEGGDTSCHH